MAPLPRDENWIADLGSDVASGGPSDAELGGPPPLTWLAVEEGLREQRALIGTLTARLDALEKAVAEGSMRRGASSTVGPGLLSLARSTARFMRWLTARNGR